MKKKLIAGAASLAMLAGLLTATSASAATIRLPKSPMNACVIQNGIYCIESVTIATGSGQKIPLTYVPSGAEVPAKKTPVDFFAPVAQIKGGKVIDNNWWMSQYQRDVLASGKYVMQDLSSLFGTANHPEQGAKFDPKTKTYDINKPLDFYSYPMDCWNNATKSSTKSTFGACYKGSVAFVLDNEVKFFFFYPTAADAAKQIANFTGVTFIDLAELSATQQRPVWGTTYDAATKTFKATEGIIIPIWVTRDALVNGWAVAGTPAAVPADPAAAATTTTPTTESATAEATELAATAPLAPEPGVAVGTPAEAGRTLVGRWTHPDWQGLNLGALGYDGLYVEARTPNEFVSSMLFVDVLPTLTGADKKTNLAGQVGNKAYAVSLDSDIVITVKVRVGEMQTGVTVAVGTDIVVKQEPGGEYNAISITGTPVTVPLAKNVKDCEGEEGVSKANVRQFQMIAMAANDDNSGFGVEGTSGGMYVGSNGVCGLSTPVWSEADKAFTWRAAAPHFAPDGVTVNKGFYKAVIPTADAALLWGMTNPNDAASALEISLTTEEGGTAAFLKNISVKNGRIIIDVSGFEYSRPKLKIGIKKGYKPAAKILNKTTITCVKGKAVKKITAVKPACPAGYKKK
ncbi:hypothetical protein A1sIIB106_05620 [Candidatus Planktophila lacus]|uniref:hypothetical protein n=1 Tax=Candidatus Planktophila lacus TaxID=1884913 RepID=UPI000BACB940|nr:hypothetical protein [Candidatus Planktophila lacus]ASY25466.1 hypothetical protein A1sIIB106_05620 [Candidatus Planktophila lacus]